jgi:hypothetical protein
MICAIDQTIDERCERDQIPRRESVSTAAANHFLESLASNLAVNFLKARERFET